jgi:hypothetical protein
MALREAAQYLHCNYPTVHRLVRDGDLLGFRLGAVGGFPQVPRPARRYEPDRPLVRSAIHFSISERDPALTRSCLDAVAK